MDWLGQLLLLLVTGLTTSTTPVTSTAEMLPVGTTTAMVARVIDGDTIDVYFDGQTYRVRYIGIDTPELESDGTPECFSQAATERNRELVAGRLVTLVSDQTDVDKYGRLLRYVYVDNILVNEVLVQEGYAETLPIPPNISLVTRLRYHEIAAIKAGRGVWSNCVQ